VCRSWDIGLVRVPIEQVERPRLFTHHVIVDHIAPDQVRRAKPVKRLAHHLARHDAIMLVDHRVDLLERVVAREDLQFAREIEI